MLAIAVFTSSGFVRSHCSASRVILYDVSSSVLWAFPLALSFINVFIIRFSQSGRSTVKRGRRIAWLSASLAISPLERFFAASFSFFGQN